MVKAKLDSFFAQFKLLHFKKHKIILCAQDIPPGVFCIKKGYVRQFLISRKGHELTTALYKPLDIFPLDLVIKSVPSRSYFEAMTPVEVWKAPKDKFIGLLISQPDVFLKLVRRLINRLDAFSQRMEFLAFGSSGARVASILLICAERFGSNVKQGVVIQIPLTHKDISSLLGLARETVSIEMKKLKNKKIFTTQNQLILVKDLEKLKNESFLI